MAREALPPSQAVSSRRHLRNASLRRGRRSVDRRGCAQGSLPEGSPGCPSSPAPGPAPLDNRPTGHGSNAAEFPDGIVYGRDYRGI